MDSYYWADINTAAMTMSGFHMAPRVGHLNRLRHIYGYLLKSKHASITLVRVRTEEPVFSDLSDSDHDDLIYFAYVKVVEVLPVGAPEPLGNHVTLTPYVDANLMHNIAMGRPVTTILHLVSTTPVNCIPGSRPLWKQQPMNLRLFRLESVLNKLLIYKTH
jgi:hypothetical protein